VAKTSEINVDMIVDSCSETQKNFCRLLKKSPEARRAIERNEGYGSFSAAC
jgi:aspartokinase